MGLCISSSCNTPINTCDLSYCYYYYCCCCCCLCCDTVLLIVLLLLLRRLVPVLMLLLLLFLLLCVSWMTDQEHSYHFSRITWIWMACHAVLQMIRAFYTTPTPCYCPHTHEHKYSTHNGKHSDTIAFNSFAHTDTHTHNKPRICFEKRGPLQFNKTKYRLSYLGCKFLYWPVLFWVWGYLYLFMGVCVCVGNILKYVRHAVVELYFSKKSKKYPHFFTTTTWLNISNKRGYGWVGVNCCGLAVFRKKKPAHTHTHT